MMKRLPINNASICKEETYQRSMWDLLVRRPQRRLLSKLRWKVLQKGEPIEEHWSALCEHWAKELTVEDTECFPKMPQRLLRVESKLMDEVDGTTKWLLETHDSQRVEAVLIPSSKSNRATACISSQVGCGVKCVFCATGTLGRIRDLHAYEILEQLLVIREECFRRNIRLRNVVFMGMGEPLHNWSNVESAIDFILRDDGFYFSPAHVCVSTAGVVSKLLECAYRFPSLRLAISLHTCEPSMRRQVVPRGVSSLQDIRNAIIRLNSDFPGRAIWLELVMIEGITDRDVDVEELLRFCAGLQVEINLIPYNTVSLAAGSSDGKSDGKAAAVRLQRSGRVWEIAQRLRSGGYFTTIRYSGGQSIAAACGQLAAGKP